MFVYRSKSMFGLLRHILIAAALLLSGAAFAQPPVAGGGCTPGAHVFCVVNANDTSTNPAPGAGTGTLRQALIDSNAAGGANTIGFSIPTNPAHPTPQTITLAIQFPDINLDGNITSLTIDGYSQPGSVLNTNAPDQGGLTTKLMIAIVGIVRGFGACCASPIPDLTVQGVNLQGFDTAIIGGPTTNVYGCFIGTNVDGTRVGRLRIRKQLPAAATCKSAAPSRGNAI